MQAWRQEGQAGGSWLHFPEPGTVRPLGMSIWSPRGNCIAETDTDTGSQYSTIDIMGQIFPVVVFTRWLQHPHSSSAMWLYH